jgi:hypothetical protein
MVADVKELRSKAMRNLLSEAQRKVKRPPLDGMMISLIYRTLRNGWHYQVEHIHDTRFRPKPYIVVYAFKPPRTYHARSADYFLESA